MTVYYSEEVSHTFDEKKKVKSFQAKNPKKVSNSFGNDIVVIESSDEHCEGVSEDNHTD